MYIRFCFLVLIISGLACFPTRSQVLLSDTTQEYHPSAEITFREDPSHQYTFEQVIRDRGKGFQALKTANPNFGFTNSSYWLSWKMKDNSTQNVAHWLLEIGFSAYAEIDVYILDENRRVIHQAAGDWRTDQNRIVSFHNYVFPLPLTSGKEYQLYVRLRPLIGQVIIPLAIWKSTAFTRYAELYNMFWGIYIGMLLIVFLYHGIVYIFNRTTPGYEGYLYLTGYLLMYLVFELTRGSCLGVRYLWPHNRWMIDNGFITMFFVSSILFILFYGKMLNLKQYTPKLLWVITFSVGCWGITLLLLYTHVLSVSKNALTLLVGTVIGGLIITAAYVSWYKRRGYRPGLYYLLAASMLYFGGVTLLLTRWGMLPSGHFFSMNALNMGSLLEFVMLSIGLGLQIQWEQQKNRQQVREVQEAQIKLIENTYLQTQDDERRELSMLLHDQFANELWSLRQNIQKLYTEYMSTMNTKRFEEALETIKKVLDGIRMISHYYIPDQFEEKGLKTTLHELTQRLEASTSVRYLLHLKGQEEQLPIRTQLQLYYIIFELLTNSNKHARATEAGLLSYREKGLYVFEIRDNGYGELPKIDDAKGSGLKNIQRRLNTIGATMDVQSSPGKGMATIIRVRLSRPF